MMNQNAIMIKHFIVGASPKPYFIFWLEPKNEAKKFKRPHPTFGHPLQLEREKRKKEFARFTRKTYAQLA